MKRKIILFLLFTVSTNFSFAAREEIEMKKRTTGTAIEEKKEQKPVKEEYNEEKSILSYIKKEGYKEKSELRNTTDITMDKNVKEIEAEKNGITYTLFIKAYKDTETVEIVDTNVKEYYDILNEIKNGNSQISHIEAATYTQGTDVMVYLTENISRDEYREIGRALADKIKNSNPFVKKVQVFAYNRYNTGSPLFKESF